VYFPHLLKYQDFWVVKSMLTELYSMFEAPFGVSKYEFFIC